MFNITRLIALTIALSALDVHLMASPADHARDRMMAELGDGGSATTQDRSMAHKIVLIRGCDPVMAQRAGKFLPPQIGEAKIVSATADDGEAGFLALLEKGKYDVVMFAPGACRWAGAGEAIPGGNAETTGWGLREYAKLVREKLGNEIPIVGSAEEREVVPMLRAALGLDGGVVDRKLEL